MKIYKQYENIQTIWKYTNYKHVIKNCKYINLYYLYIIYLVPMKYIKNI